MRRDPKVSTETEPQLGLPLFTATRGIQLSPLERACIHGLLPTDVIVGCTRIDGAIVEAEVHGSDGTFRMLRVLASEAR